MIRLGRNQGGYRGETIAIDAVLRQILWSAHRLGWRIDTLEVAPDCTIPVLTRSPRIVPETGDSNPWIPRIYISTGIHGDEPAGPLAIRALLDADAFPARAWLWLCPCLNPSGFNRNTRESIDGTDLNRDYRSLRSPEVRTHVEWLRRQPVFDMTLCLHEDWEAAGFYLYELNPDARPSLAGAMIAAARNVAPIDLSPTIDGRPALDGVIRPAIDPASRPEWPEALYLLQHHTRLSYTLESPSDFALNVRVEALAAAVRAAMPPSSGSTPTPA